MEFLIGLVSLWIVWLISSRRWRKRLLVPLISLAIGLIILSPVGLQLMLLGLTMPLPRDTGNPVQAIVVLGRGPKTRDYRVAIAQELWQAKRAPKIFVSGMLDARSIVESLQEIGLPGESLAGEECSQSTEENALFSATILRPQKVETILLVTDEPHMLRAILVFRSFKFRVIPAPIRLKTLNLEWASLLLLREYFALASYAVTGKFKPQLTASETVPTSPLLSRIKDWECQVQGSPIKS